MFLDLIGYMIIDEREAQDEMYLHNIKTFEALTESAFQLDITVMIAYAQGVNDIFVLVSASISFITLSKCLASRLAAVRRNKEVEVLSWSFGKAFLDTIIVFVFGILGSIFITLSGEGHVPNALSMAFKYGCRHPLPWFILLFAFKLFQNMTVHHLSLIIFFVEFGLNYYFHVSDFLELFNIPGDPNQKL